MTNYLPNNEIVDQLKLKAFADDKLITIRYNLDQLRLKAFADNKGDPNGKKFVVGEIENITGKEENAGYQHFLQNAGYQHLLLCPQ